MSESIAFRIFNEMADIAKEHSKIRFSNTSDPDWVIYQFLDGSQIKIKYECAEANHEVR